MNRLECVRTCVCVCLSVSVCAYVLRYDGLVFFSSFFWVFGRGFGGFWAESGRSTYLLSGYGIVALNGVRLAVGNNHRSAHLGLWPVRNCGPLRRRLKCGDLHVKMAMQLSLACNSSRCRPHPPVATRASVLPPTSRSKCGRCTA